MCNCQQSVMSFSKSHYDAKLRGGMKPAHQTLAGDSHLPPLASAAASGMKRPTNLEALAGRRNGYRHSSKRYAHIDGEAPQGDGSAPEKEMSGQKPKQDGPSLLDQGKQWVNDNQLAAAILFVVGASILFKQRSAIEQAGRRLQQS